MNGEQLARLALRGGALVWVGALALGVWPVRAERPCRQDQEVVSLTGHLEHQHRAVAPGERVRRARQQGRPTEELTLLRLHTPLCMRVLSASDGHSRPRQVTLLQLQDPDHLLPAIEPGGGSGRAAKPRHRVQGRLMLADDDAPGPPVALEVEAVEALKGRHASARSFGP